MPTKKIALLAPLFFIAHACGLSLWAPEPLPPLLEAGYYYQVGGTPESGIRQVLFVTLSDSLAAGQKIALLAERDTVHLRREPGTQERYSGSRAVSRQAISQSKKSLQLALLRWKKDKLIAGDTVNLRPTETEFLPTAPPREED